MLTGWRAVLAGMGFTALGVLIVVWAYMHFWRRDIRMFAQKRVETSGTQSA